MNSVAARLALWYAEHGRELPWRDSPDAYRVWLSEVILQQTTVKQGTDYFLRFVRRWPTVEALASATEDEVLREWQGLGYYSRARNLYAAAKKIQAMGSFPSTYDEIRALPGVGPYTAAAIASIAYGLPCAVVDGNVYRVLARFFGDPGPVNSGPGSRNFWTRAQEILDPGAPGRHNQAMMDFGALQCTVKSPRCTDCPLATDCVALAENAVDKYPVRLPRKAAEKVTMDYTLLCSPDGLFLRRRPKTGIWAGLWELVATPDMASVASFPERQVQELGMFRHQLTHRSISCSATVAQFTSEQQSGIAASLAAKHYIFVAWDALDAHALPRLIERIISAYRKNH